MTTRARSAVQLKDLADGLRQCVRLLGGLCRWREAHTELCAFLSAVQRCSYGAFQHILADAFARYVCSCPALLVVLDKRGSNGPRGAQLCDLEVLSRSHMDAMLAGSAASYVVSDVS